MKVTMTSLLLLCFFACGLESKSMNEGDKRPELQSAEQLDTYSKAYFASGCFWCVEAVYESVRGVVEVESGYSGGKEKNPTYEQVGAGRTGHAEAVVVYYDPAVVDFATLVDVYYGSQDPTTVDGQAPDFGRQYRSIIFYSNENERLIAEEKKRALAESGMYSAPIATEIVAFEKFWPAEDYHQNYEKLHPDNGYVMKVSIPRLNRFKAKFPELLK
ncbi:MAG: peptide-methionine (S)-S-oxide reductase MsrA [Cryomorphaceae bacterium]|nr:peptide-methionine (S)-S-oxide reductase MsrA [Cryomorphaceae bacterium]